MMLLSPLMKFLQQTANRWRILRALQVLIDGKLSQSPVANVCPINHIDRLVLHCIYTTNLTLLQKFFDAPVYHQMFALFPILLTDRHEEESRGAFFISNLCLLFRLITFYTRACTFNLIYMKKILLS